MTMLPRVQGDYGFNGFFDVRDPQALFEKMRYDYGRMIAEPLNVFPAWDFFVTANHLIDWIWPSAGSAQHREERKWEAIPRICEHLANGAKHFIVNREHRAVAQIERVQGAFDAAAFDASAFDTERLLITLDAKEAGELCAEQITAADLARRVLIYWGRRIGQGDISQVNEMRPAEHKQQLVVLRVLRNNLRIMRKTATLGALFPTVRGEVLAATLTQPAKWWYLSELAQFIRTTPSSLQRELKALVDGGILEQRREGSHDVQRHRTSKKELDDMRALVARDLADAGIAGLSADRRFATAYNAALQAANMAIACSGYRVTAKTGHHKITFYSANLALGSGAD